MNKSIKIFFIVTISILQSIFLYAQTTTSKAETVKWGVIRGNDNEVVIYMPQVFDVIIDDGYSSGKSNSKIKKRLVFSRYINGVVLITEYYEGETEKIQKNLQKKEKLPVSKTGIVNGFDSKEFSGNLDGYFFKTQYYKVKNGLYVIKSISKSEKNEIVETYFKSLSLTNNNRLVFPNILTESNGLDFPNIIEQKQLEINEKVVYELEDVDRNPITLYLSIPKLSITERIKSPNGTVKLKVLCSSTGRVTDIKVKVSPSKILSDAAIEAAKKTKFIPAEKDGKLVSVYQLQEYNFIIR